MQRVLVFAATALLAACPSPRRPRALDDTPLRLRVARAEATRGAGVAELVELARHGEPEARVLALRGLGRIGGPEAMAVLAQALDDGDPAIRAAAYGAIGVAAALDGELVTGDPAVQAALAKDRGAPATRAVAIARLAAWGRAGDARFDRELDAALADRDPEVAAAAALALARHGRRKIAIDGADETALEVASRHADARVREAATFALGVVRPIPPPVADAHPSDAAPTGRRVPWDPSLGYALAARVTDAEPAIRAAAIAGLARLGDVHAARMALSRALADPDWRVAVEAVRALAGAHGDDAGRDEVAGALVQRWTRLAAGDEVQAQVIAEGLRVLAPYGARPLVATALAALRADTAGATRVAPLARGWIDCLAAVALARAQPRPDVDALAACGHGELPDHLRLPVLAQLVTAGAGDAATRRAALRVLLSHADARVRAAGLGALAAAWRDGGAADHQTLVATLASALGSPDPVVAGAAIDAAPDLYAAMGDDPGRAALDAAVVARAAAERDLELSSDLYALIGKRAIAAGAGACRAGLAGPPVRARAAASCLRALGEATTPPPIAAAVPPPVDVAAVIGHAVRWQLVTTRGEIVIDLRPDVAPWNVAAIVALTRRGFYDGLEVHRVVPDFVVQGGDPTMSGWGGPGFVTPAEPATSADAPGFVAGGVGMADAGRDSAGSQWFVMHARAPHLDGRYTWVGAVVAGGDVADRLLIGDRVLRATVEVH